MLPLAPTFSTRFFSTAFLSTPSGAGSGMLSSGSSGSCSEMPSWVLTSSSPCGEGCERGWGCESITRPRGGSTQQGWAGWGARCLSVPPPRTRGAQRSVPPQPNVMVARSPGAELVLPPAWNGTNGAGHQLLEHLTPVRVSASAALKTRWGVFYCLLRWI